MKDCLPQHKTKVVIADKIENHIKNGKAYQMFLSLVDENP